MALYFKNIPSPLGQLRLVANDTALIAILWEQDQEYKMDLGEMTASETHEVLCNTKQQLDEYFAGTRQSFDLPLTFYGTAFQQKVWQALLKIPYGQTCSYKDIAIQIGNQKAVRAVGTANGKNPISIIAACHRVIGANGKLVGYTGGLDKKTFLLALEQQNSH